MTKVQEYEITALLLLILSNVSHGDVFPVLWAIGSMIYLALAYLRGRFEKERAERDSRALRHPQWPRA